MAVSAAVLIASPGLAQSADTSPPDGQILAEISAEIKGLQRQLQALSQELVAPDPLSTGIENPAPLRARVEETAAEVTRLQAALEAAEQRIEAVVADGNNRIGDLEFRLLELSGGDYANYQEPAPLGSLPGADPGDPQNPQAAVASAAPAPPAPRSAPAEAGESETATLGLDPGLSAPAAPAAPTGVPATEAEAFQAALARYQSGDYQGAAQDFETLLDTYANGSLSGEALFWRGEALAALGQWNQAARSYLNSFSGAPQGAKAPEALYRLGVSLARLGQTEEACLTLAEVPRRYQTIPQTLTDQIGSETRALACP
ncbi:MAG: tol-pal system protein YbgF [Pseudomonadota bacterium]